MTTKIKIKSGSGSSEKNIIAAILDIKGLTVVEENLHDFGVVIKSRPKVKWVKLPGLINRILSKYNKLHFYLEGSRTYPAGDVLAENRYRIYLVFRVRDYRKINSSKIIQDVYKSFDEVCEFSDFLMVTTDFARI